jgi:small subunit ribosomal protein S20
MPNSKQAKKRVAQNETRRDHNKIVKTRMRTSIKKVLNADTADAAGEALPIAMKQIDKAAKANIIHSNAAGRYKARLARNIAAKG